MFLVLVVIIAGSLTGAALAATTDFVADGNVGITGVVYGAFTSELTIMNGSKAESIDFTSGTFTVTNPDATAGFKVGSGTFTAKSIRVRSQAQSSETVCADNTTLGTSYVTLPTTADVYTVYGSETACEGSGSTSGGGGGGGGNNKPKKPKATTPAVPATPAVPGVSPAIPASPALFNASPNARFNRPLSAGGTGDDVRELQRFLNQRGFMIASAGPGSPGNETNYFGPATKAAVIKFQVTNGIIASASEQGAGRVGPLTTAKLNELAAGAPASAMPPASSAAPMNIPTDPVARQALVQTLTTQLESLKAQLQAMLAAQAGN